MEQPRIEERSPRVKEEMKEEEMEEEMEEETMRARRTIAQGRREYLSLGGWIAEDRVAAASLRHFESTPLLRLSREALAVLTSHSPVEAEALQRTPRSSTLQRRTVVNTSSSKLSTPLLTAKKAPTTAHERELARRWSIEGVADWARHVGVAEVHASKLIDEEIDGEVLESMTYERFMQCGIKGGPATKLYQAVKELFGISPAAASVAPNIGALFHSVYSYSLPVFPYLSSLPLLALLSSNSALLLKQSCLSLWRPWCTRSTRRTGRPCAI